MWVYNCVCGGLTVSPVHRCAAVGTAGHWGHTDVLLYSGVTAWAFIQWESGEALTLISLRRRLSPVWDQLAIFTGDMLRTALVLSPPPWTQGPPNLLWGDNKGCSFASCPSQASLCLATLEPWSHRRVKQFLVPFIGVWNRYFSWFDLGENVSKNVTGWVLNCTLCHGPLSELSRTCDQHVWGQEQ